jgi:hypothetical protein
VRPSSVTVCSAVLLLAMVIAVGVTAMLLLPSSATERLWSLNPAAGPWFMAHRALGVLLIVGAGVAAGLAGLGLWRGRRWGWWIAVLIFAANGVGDLVRFALGDYAEGVVGVTIVAAFLVLLALPATRRYAAS